MERRWHLLGRGQQADLQLDQVHVRRARRKHRPGTGGHRSTAAHPDEEQEQQNRQNAAPESEHREEHREAESTAAATDRQASPSTSSPAAKAAAPTDAAPEGERGNREIQQDGHGQEDREQESVTL